MYSVLIISASVCILSAVTALCIQKTVEKKRRENEEAERKFQETLKEIEANALSLS